MGTLAFTLSEREPCDLTQVFSQAPQFHPFSSCLWNPSLDLCPPLPHRLLTHSVSIVHWSGASVLEADRRPGFESCLQHLGVLLLWASSLTSLTLSFLICKIGSW